MTVSQEPQTTASSSSRQERPSGLLRWRKQRREATTSAVQRHLQDTGSTRVCSGLVSTQDRVTVACSQCRRPKTVRVSELLNTPRVWCKSCAAKERMQGTRPSQKMLQAAREANEANLRVQRCGASPEEWEPLMRWAKDAKRRCENPNRPEFKNYGGRGIEFRFASPSDAARWAYTHLGPRPSPGMTLDRTNNEGHYEPGNLRWATAVTQSQNRGWRTPGWRTELDGEPWVWDPDEWPYGQTMVRRLLAEGLTREQIIARAHDTVRNRRGRWTGVAARLKRMTS